MVLDSLPRFGLMFADITGVSPRLKDRNICVLSDETTPTFGNPVHNYAVTHAEAIRVMMRTAPSSIILRCDPQLLSDIDLENLLLTSVSAACTGHFMVLPQSLMENRFTPRLQALINSNTSLFWEMLAATVESQQTDWLRRFPLDDLTFLGIFSPFDYVVLKWLPKILPLTTARTHQEVIHWLTHGCGYTYHDVLQLFDRSHVPVLDQTS